MLVGMVTSTTAVADGSCGESALLAQRNATRNAQASYSAAARHAEMRGLAALDPGELNSSLPGMRVASAQDHAPVPIDADRSLFIRDRALLSAFSFNELMAALAQSTGDQTLSGLNLFQDWWLTSLPPKPDKDPAIGCNDKLINGIDYSCPASGGQGTLAEVSSLDGGTDAPVQIMALVNRGDLWSFETDSADCGEYRVIAGVNNDTGQFPAIESGLYLFSFEAVLRRGDNGPGFCKAVQKLWASFSTLADTEDFRSLLRKFYLEQNGLSQDGRLVAPSHATASFTFGPIMASKNLGLDGEAPELGQIRTNAKFTSSNGSWFFREYRFRNLPGTGQRLLPVGLAATPVKLSGDPGHPHNQRLADEIGRNSDGLVTKQFDDVRFVPSDRCLDAGEDIANDRSGIRSIMQKYFSGQSPNPAVQALAKLANSDLTVRDLANNLDFTTCVGCHNTTGKWQLNHLVAPYADFETPGKIGEAWDRPLSFHFARFDIEPGTISDRYAIAHQLENVFLPKRKHLMRFVLENDPLPKCPDLRDSGETPVPGCSVDGSGEIRIFQD